MSHASDSLDSHESSEGAELAEYRRVCATAILGLLCGLAAPLAMVAPVLWLVPLCGAFASGLALWRISRSAGTLTGRRLALAGLALSVMFGTAGPVARVSDTMWIAAEARPIADAWFDFLARGQPQLAHPLTLAPVVRAPSGEDPWTYYRLDQAARDSLQRFVKDRTVRTLLALGTSARISPFETAWTEHAEEHDRVCLIYSATFGDDAARKTFFVNLIMRRTLQPQTGQAQWQIQHYAGGVTPPALQK